ncbi:sushi, von Willebrand factor type A, EGF and pentraxin domain-containing protein 1-like [Ruditapes philippinarum]|uniref:sushi, von Willebrand factor type A, EGF and pentraxin domain-containing protein 1-like n=1 Tax=Ruditapes philippinarum TaxID=129788 RepID=UPI00295BF968|nr:sushi, von Willebrand factor type A, EGF and pentraxin domain-containing protein 1-like [Ruditapes philippinarum]
MTKIITNNDCGSSLSVSNGNVTFTTTTYGSSASLVCDTGYETTKATLNCLDTGIWETSTCTIKDCGSSLSVSNGNVTFTTTTYGSSASLVCDTGYETTKATLNCFDTGSWETSTCTIKDCGSSLSVSNGNVTFTTTTYGSSASLVCDTGYETTKATLNCLDTGSWETSTCTIKDCGSSLSVSNGNVTFTTTTYGSSASLVCDTGYETTKATLNCLDTGSWETSTCTIKDCGSSLSVSNGNVTFTTTTYGSSASLVCNTGYETTKATLNCLDTGSWETSTCTIKDCGSSLSVSNGNVTFTTTTYGSSAFLVCNTGYETTKATLNCLDTGSWEISTCTIKDCGSSLSVSNGNVTFTTTTYGSSASLVCDTGYETTKATLNCLDTGSWETSTCTIKDCGSSLSVSNGNVTFTTTTYGSSASLVCDTGYETTKATLNCLDTGSWETSTCTIKDCGSSLSVSNGNVTFTTTTYGSSASLVCDTGYETTKATLNCLDTGSWETSTCTIKDCGSSLSVSNGNVTFTTTTYGSSASLVCNTGYETTKATLNCLDTGSWETSTCTIKDCGSSLSVSNGNVTFTTTTYGSSASLVCDTGYETTKATLNCLDTGSWETSTCTIKDCGSSLSVSNGNVTFTTTTYGSSASLVCDTGYETTKATLNCLDTGSWETSTCTIKDCGSSLSVSNGNVTFTTTTYGSSASLVCDTGYETTKATLNCLDTGSWETSTCTIKDCGSSLSVSNGNVTFTTTTYGSNASLVCDTGYETTKATLTCLDTGSWETSTCTIIDCGNSSISNGILTYSTTTYQSSATVTCDKGYTASTDSISCEANGSWQSVTCDIVDCGSSLPSISQGSVTLDDPSLTTYLSRATVACETGFTSDKSSIYCKANGAWSKATCT